MNHLFKVAAWIFKGSASGLRKPFLEFQFSLWQVLDLDCIKTHHWQILRCSAMTGENLLQGVDWLLQDIGARIFTLD